MQGTEVKVIFTSDISINGGGYLGTYFAAPVDTGGPLLHTGWGSEPPSLAGICCYTGLGICCYTELGICCYTGLGNQKHSHLVGSVNSQCGSQICQDVENSYYDYYQGIYGRIINVHYCCHYYNVINHVK